MIEYVPPKTAEEPSDDESEGAANIKFIKPAVLSDIPIQQYHNITVEVELDKSITEAYPDIAPSSAISGLMVSQMCALEHNEGNEFNVFDAGFDFPMYKTNTIMPIEYEVSKDFTKVSLRFPTVQAYENYCYALVCKKDLTLISGTYYNVKQTSNIETKY